MRRFILATVSAVARMAGVARPNREELGELAVGRPAVPDGADTVHVSQEPADAEGVAESAAP